MPLLINLRHLEAHSVRLKGEMAMEELDIDTLDEMIQVVGPLEHDLEVQRVEDGLLVQGRLDLGLQCRCVRCLKAFERRVGIGSWTRLLQLEGEESVAVVNDCVDLTPYVREDMLLEFPQHPLCNPECQGLSSTELGKPWSINVAGQPESGSPAWNELNKLKF